MFLRARYYEPQTAQFLTRDPIEPQTRSPYGYADDTPVNAIDPSGLGVFQDIADAASGAYDAGTFGATKWIRGAIGSDGVNYCSTSYALGSVAGVAASLAVPGGGELRGAELAEEAAQGLRFTG